MGLCGEILVMVPRKVVSVSRAQQLLQKEAAVHGETLQEQPQARATAHGEEPAVGQHCLKSCRLWEAHTRSVQEWQHPLGGTHCDSEGVAETKCYGLTTAPIPHALWHLWGRGV